MSVEAGNDNSIDPISEVCRRTGERLGDAVFRDFGTSASEAQIFAVERLTHGPSDAALDMLGATDDQRLLAKIMIGHCLRRRYEALVCTRPIVGKMNASADD